MNKLIIFVFISFILTLEVKCEDEDVNNLFEDTQRSQIQDGPVQFEIVGDTSHLFADEDFEKKEVILLGDTNANTNTESRIPQSDYIEILRDSINSFSNSSEKTPKKPSKCTLSSRPTDPNSVQLINGSALTQHLSDTNETECFLVLFYVPWCPFSARLAPIYNALPRAFANFDILAFDVSKSIGYNSKFGTSSVPMIILFQHKNIVTKFNYTNKSLIDYIDFVYNRTGFNANRSIAIEVTDLEGPVPTVVEKYFDYYLLMSWLLVSFVTVDLLLRKTQLKAYLVRFINFLFTDTRQRQIVQGPQRHMIQNNEDHPHND